MIEIDVILQVFGRELDFCADDVLRHDNILRLSLEEWLAVEEWIVWPARIQALNTGANSCVFAHIKAQAYSNALPG